MLAFAKFYAALTETLVATLGERELAGLIHQPTAAASWAAVQRFFMRLGGDAPQEIESISAFVTEMATAVNRTSAQVLAVLCALATAQGVCGNQPQCEKCKLTRSCDFYNAPPAPKNLSLAERLAANLPLTAVEYLALLFGGDKPKAADFAAAENVQARFGDLRRATRAGFNELVGLRDLSKTAAVRLAAVNGILQSLAQTLPPPSSMTQPRDFYEIYHPRFCGLQREIFLVVLLDSKHKIIRDETVVQGSLAQLMLKTGEVLAPAVRDGAAAVVFIHNHPSGDYTPSAEDCATTKNLCAAAKLLNLKVLDHLIITDGGFYSFNQQGLIA